MCLFSANISWYIEQPESEVFVAIPLVPLLDDESKRKNRKNRNNNIEKIRFKKMKNIYVFQLRTNLIVFQTIQIADANYGAFDASVIG